MESSELESSFHSPMSASAQAVQRTMSKRFPKSMSGFKIVYKLIKGIIKKLRNFRAILGVFHVAQAFQASKTSNTSNTEAQRSFSPEGDRPEQSEHVTMPHKIEVHR